MLSLKTAVPVSKPAPCGVKLKLSVQTAPGANGNALAQSGSAPCVKFTPRFKAREPVSDWLPTF